QGLCDAVELAGAVSNELTLVAEDDGNLYLTARSDGGPFVRCLLERASIPRPQSTKYSVDMVQTIAQAARRIGPTCDLGFSGGYPMRVKVEPPRFTKKTLGVTAWWVLAPRSEDP
ncbi:MAG: hypothetical protein ACREN5_07380, partial [Gemmatimonadales bacterium]